MRDKVYQTLLSDYRELQDENARLREENKDLAKCDEDHVRAIDRLRGELRRIAEHEDIEVHDDGQWHCELSVDHLREHARRALQGSEEK